jgi:Co/Zn/Cd efflux system component
MSSQRWTAAGSPRRGPGVPEGIDLGKVRAYLLALPGVTDVHDLHVWR